MREIRYASAVWAWKFQINCRGLQSINFCITLFSKQNSWWISPLYDFKVLTWCKVPIENIHLQKSLTVFCGSILLLVFFFKFNKALNFSKTCTMVYCPILCIVRTITPRSPKNSSLTPTKSIWFCASQRACWETL